MPGRPLFQRLIGTGALAAKSGFFGLLILTLSSSLTHTAAQQSARHAAKISETLQQAEVLLQQGHPDEAKAKIEEDLQRNPSVEGYNLLGIIASSQHDYAAALTALEDALHLAPNSAKSHNNLGNVYVAQKKFDLAEKEFRTVLRLDPANRDANYNLGVLLLARKSPTEAIPLFERVRPPDTATKFNLIQAYFGSKRSAEALRMATELSAENKDNVQVQFSLGVMLASEKQYVPALVELEKADALKPGTFEILYNLGQTYLRSKEYAKAELTLNRALKLMPDSAETLHLLAQVYADESRPLDALDLLVRAHKIAPENTDIIYLMAQLGISQNYFEDAIPLLESGLKLAPDRPDLLAALGESYFMSGKADKAIVVFEKLIAIDPSARSYSFLGVSYRELGRYDEAKKYFEQGLKLDPHDSSCLFNLGLIAERQGDTAGAESMLEQTLRYNPDYADALLELANLRTTAKRLPEAAELLRRYVKVSRNPTSGYYKLAMVERSMHETTAAERDLSVFQTLSKTAPTGPYPYENLYQYLDNRSKLSAGARDQLDIAQINEEIKKHPDQPQNLYLLAEAYLKAGKVDDARNIISQLNKLSANDFRTQTGVGVLLARYHLYDDAIQQFQAALRANPGSDEVKFDLANAYFRRGLYPQALDVAGQVSEAGSKDDGFLSLLGDIYAHTGEMARAEEIYRDAISRNPDNDQDYLALALLQFRQNDPAAARQTLLKGQARIPASGKLLWGLGIASVLDGNTAQAAQQFERAVDLLPEWAGSYSTLGIFYYQTGQISKAKEVLGRFKNSNAGGLDVNRIEEALEKAPETSPAGNEPMTMASRQQLLQMALTLADRTL
jgi:tetratricopeptide (TPR) repeat protein